MRYCEKIIIMLINTYEETARDTMNLDIMMNFLAKQDSKLKRSLERYQRDLDKGKIRRK
jgi:hypothetical protein